MAESREEVRLTGKAAGFAFMVVIPGVAFVMIGHIGLVAGFSVIIVSAGLGLADIVWLLSPGIPWRRKVGPILLGAGAVIALGFAVLWFIAARRSAARDLAPIEIHHLAPSTQQGPQASLSMTVHRAVPVQDENTVVGAILRAKRASNDAAVQARTTTHTSPQDLFIQRRLILRPFIVEWLNANPGDRQDRDAVIEKIRLYANKRLKEHGYDWIVTPEEGSLIGGDLVVDSKFDRGKGVGVSIVGGGDNTFIGTDIKNADVGVALTDTKNNSFQNTTIETRDKKRGRGKPGDPKPK